MKYHEEDKLNALLEFMGISEDDATEVMDCIRNKESDTDDLYHIVERIKILG